MKILIRTVAIIFMIIGAGCSEEAEISYELSIVSGNSQEAIQGTALSQPIVIKVTDSNGNAQEGIVVSAVVFEGGGSLENISSSSDDSGLIQINWKLGEEISQRMRASVKDFPEVNIELQARTSYRYEVPAQDQDGWEVASLDFLNETSQDVLFDGIDELRAGDYPEVHSVVVMHNKKLVLENYYPGSNSNGVVVDWNRFSPHEIQSASKSFRSMLIGIAIDQGVIQDVEVPFFSFFPDHSALNDEDLKGDIKLKHVLTMSAGFDWDEWSFPFGHANNNLSTMYAKPRNQWVPYVLGLPMKNTPGSSFAYSTGTSLMLANVIQNSLSTTLRSFTQTYYSDLVEGNPSNDPNAAAMTPRQMAKMGYIYLYDGKWKDNQVVSPDWIKESIVPKFNNINSSGGYGYQWWLKTFTTAKKGYDCFYASGNGGQFVVVNTELDLVVVFTGGNFGSNQMFNVLNWMEDHVFTAFEPD